MADALAWSARVSVPFDWQWSKNRMWSARAGTYARKLATHARARRDGLVFALRAELRGRKVANNVLLCQFHVELPDHKGDAINCLDLACDAIEIATGLDDKWFAIAGLSWAVVKDHEPQLQVWIGQKDLTDVKICGRCGLALPFDAFNKRKNTPTGRESYCRACRKIMHAEKRAARKAKAEADAPPEPEPTPGTDPPWRAS